MSDDTQQRYIDWLRQACRMQKTLLIGTKKYPEPPLVWQGEVTPLGKPLGHFEGLSLTGDTIGRIMKSSNMDVYLQLVTFDPEGREQPPMDIQINKVQWSVEGGFWDVTLIANMSRSWSNQNNLYIRPCTKSDALRTLINRRRID